MSKQDTVSVIVKEVRTEYKEYTLTYTEFQEYMASYRFNEEQLRFVPKLWKWMKGKNTNQSKKISERALFTMKDDSHFPEEGEGGVEDYVDFKDTIRKKIQSWTTRQE